MSGVAMSSIAPKGHQHLSAAALMSAFALFALQSPALLVFDKQRAEGNVGRLYGMKRVLCDTQMRA